MKIYEKLLKLQTELVVSKDKFNDFANFKYRSCEDILQAIKPYLKELNCIILLNDELTNIGDKIYIKAEAKLIDITDGESVSTFAHAQEPPKAKSKMDESQTTGSTSSYARKYALNGLLALDDNVDSDSTNKGPKEEVKNFITKEQIEELKKLGFDQARFEDMVKYFKKTKLEEVTFEQAKGIIERQKKAVKHEG